MTKDLFKLSQIIEAKAFLRNQIIEWTRIVQITQLHEAQQFLVTLQKSDTELTKVYNIDLHT